jgi:formate dehydrogenase subunit gamma
MPDGTGEERIREIVAAHRALEGPAMPILHAVQEEFGHVPAFAIPLIAEALNVSRAEMYGVVTFYHDFREEPAGRHVLKLCQAEACQAAGGRAVTRHVEGRTGLALGETSADGRLTVEAIYCLGLCACAPSAMLDDRLVGRLDATKADRLLAEVRR